MGISNGEIKAPLGVNTLANYFGTATDTFSICKASIINKWAKYKPIALSTLGLTDTPSSLTEAQRKAANYGLQAKSARSNSKADLPEKIMSVCGESGLWTYPHVVAGTDYARLDDFANPNGYSTTVGYDHSCEGPCKESDLSANHQTNVASSVTVWFTDRTKSGCPGQLHFDELPNFGTTQNVTANQTCLRNCYLCFMFKVGTEYYYIFSTDTIDNLVDWADEGASVSLSIINPNGLFTPFRNLAVGGSISTQAYLCLIDLAEAFNGEIPTSYKGGCVAQTDLSSHAYRVYALPFSEALYSSAKINISKPRGSNYLAFSFPNGIYTANGKTYVDVRIENNTTKDAVLSNIFMYLMSEHVADNNRDDVIDEVKRSWITNGEESTSGISITGSEGQGVYAAYKRIPIATSQKTITKNSSQTFHFFFNATQDAFGYSYDQWAEPIVCIQDNIGDPNGVEKDGRYIFY